MGRSQGTLQEWRTVGEGHKERNWGAFPGCQRPGSWGYLWLLAPGLLGHHREFSSRSTLTSMASVCVKLLTNPESRPVRDRAGTATGPPVLGE